MTCHAFTGFPDAADLSMAAMTSWRRTASSGARQAVSAQLIIEALATPGAGDLARSCLFQ